MGKSSMSDTQFDLKISGEGYMQPTAATCWWASYAMVYHWKGLSDDLIKSKIKKAGFDFDDYWAKGLPRTDYRKVGACLGMTGFRGGYISNLADDFKSFVFVLKAYGPLWCAFANPSPHAVVVTGVDSNLNQIHIINPWNRGGGYNADGQFPSPTEFKQRLDMTSEWVGQAINL